MSDTPILGIPEAEEATSLPWDVVNFMIRIVEAGAGYFTVFDRAENDPSGLTPAEGDRYIVASGGTDDWTGWDDRIVIFIGGAWWDIIPFEGMKAFDQAADETILFDGADWNVDGSSSGASTSQTGEQISGFIAAPADKSYTIALKMAHGGTITETTTKSASGTCTATFKINSTALGGTANSVSSSEQSQSHASSNAFSAADDIVLTVSSNSSCADMSFTIKYTRTLD